MSNNFDKQLGDVLLKKAGKEPQLPQTEAVKKNPRIISSDKVSQVANLLSGKAQAENVPETPQGEPEEEEIPVEEGERQPVTVSDLAEMLEWEPEALYNVEIPFADGDRLTLSALKDGYQELKAWRAERETAEEDLAEQLASAEEDRRQFSRRIGEANPNELNRANAELVEAEMQFKRIDWQLLEKDNPGQAALLYQKLRDAIFLKKAERDGIAQNIDAMRQEIASQEQQKSQLQLKQAKQALERAIPSWSKQDVFAVESEDVVRYAIKQGLSETAVRSIVDPALIVWMYRSMQADKRLEKAKPVNAPPKSLKPQAAVNRQVGQAKRQLNLMANARDSKDPRVKTSAIANLIMGALRNG